MNSSVQYRCQQCGICCQTKYLCLYATELKRAKYYAAKYNRTLKLEPLRRIIDEKNQKIIVLIYRVKERPCPFFLDHQCMIHKDKFVACRKYPISNWIDLGKVFTFLGLNSEFYEVDENCSFIKTHTLFKEAMKTNKLSDLLPNEFKATLEDKRIWLDLFHQLKLLEKENKIQPLKETKLKKANPKALEEILRTWEAIAATDFLRNIK